ncbi:OLC1v1016234C2 [Oldenlandia corymbosa var. corymbosa]|nr:OLC1v1016234C2 [Oldenlandia corymbosa var. corymbosa]
MGINRLKTLGLPSMNLLRVKGMPILEQLHLEERLLRTTLDNWCILNDGTNDRNIVMGVSGKPAELLNINSVLQDKVAVIRRFTGGGTVIVDHNTVFATFICNKDALPDVQPYPRPIMSWSSLIYKDVFQEVGDFSLRENDYVFGNHKFGGNAQSITKTRWIHHTSFLWDFDVNSMAYLKLPSRAPEYRKERDHLEFLCRMKDYIPRSNFIDRIIEAVGRNFDVKPMEIEAIESPTSNIVFTPTSKIVAEEELNEALSVSQL